LNPLSQNAAGFAGVNRMFHEIQEGIWDIHTHCLPGIDDGSKNWDMTLQMLQISWESGVRNVIATPHYLPWRDPVPAERIRDLCKETMERCERELGFHIAILPGAELYYYNAITEDLREGRALTMAGTSSVLVEFSEKVPWSELQAGLISLRRSGYRSILAHAERYGCLRKDGHFEELLSSGVRIQSNIQEVEGGLFSDMGRWVRRQYREGSIHFAASDMHNMSSRPPISKQQIAWFDKKVDESYRRKLFSENILAILSGG
jgi:protein-tyrosine phosphatase